MDGGGVSSRGFGFWGDVDESEALERYRTLVNTVDDGIYQLDPAGRFVAVNDVIPAITGYAREDLLGEHVSLLISEDDCRRIEAEIASRLSRPERTIRTFDLAVISAEASVIPCELRLNLLVEDGEFQGSVGIVRDVTERKRADEIIQEHQRRQRRERELVQYQALTDAARDVIVAIDEHSTIRLVNAAVEEVFGYPSDDLVGESMTVLMQDEIADRYLAGMNRYLASGNRSFDWHAVEMPGVRADGTKILVSVSFSEVEHEGERYFTGVMRDVTERKRLEAKVRESEEKFRQITENLGEVVWMTTVDNGELLYVNPSYEDVWGRSCESLYDHPRSFLADIHPADQDRVRSAIDQQVTGEYDETYRVVRPDETVRWVRDRAYPIENDDGEVYRIVGIAEDITERREIQRELRRERDLIEGIVETIPVGITVVDPDGGLTFANERAVSILGRDHEAIDTYEYDDPRWDLVDTSGSPLAAGEAPFDRVISREESVYDQVVGIRRPDGDRVWLSVNGAPQWDESGELERAVFAFEDITHERAVETEFEEILGRVTDAFFALDEDFRFTHVNEQAEDLLEISADDVLGETLWERFPEAADIPEIWDAFHTAMKTGEAQGYELYYEPLEFWVEASVYPSATGVSVYFRDVTVRKEREGHLRQLVTELEASNERLEQFAYAASHDLQEPLRMVVSYLQLLENRIGADLDDETVEFFEFAVQGADRMRAMVDGLLAYSRVHTREDRFGTVDLDDVLAGAIHDLELKIEETNAVITAGDLPCVWGDVSQLRQVFQNLLANAIVYRGDNPPRIDITARRGRQEWVVSVRDEGIGIDPADQDRIFEVFHRLHTYEEHPGVGIGLALCERIVHHHGGEIWVESAPGDGSTFSFTLPVPPEDES